MAATVGIRLEGVQQTRAKLARFPLRMVSKFDRGVVRAGAVIFRRAARAEAPVRTGLLRKKIGYKVMRRRPGEVVAYVIRSKAPHSNLVQLGTNDRRTSTGRRLGRMTADPYMDRAFSKAEAEVLSTMHAKAAQLAASLINGL